jgi:hypothetical protein
VKSEIDLDDAGDDNTRVKTWIDPADLGDDTHVKTEIDPADLGDDIGEIDYDAEDDAVDDIFDPENASEDVSHYTLFMPDGVERDFAAEIPLATLMEMDKLDLATHFKNIGYGKLRGIGWVWSAGKQSWGFRHSKNRGKGKMKRQEVERAVSSAPWRMG